MESSLELVEDQYFKSLEVIESFQHLAQMVRAQLVTGECLELLEHLGEEIEAWSSYSDWIYRHPEEWPVYMDGREREALARLVSLPRGVVGRGRD